MLLFDGPRQHDDLACAARPTQPFLRCAYAGQSPEAPCEAARLRLATVHDTIIGALARNARATSAPLGTSGHASLSARASVNNTDALRAKPPCVRHAHMTAPSTRAPSTPVTLQPPQAGGVALATRIKRAAACSRRGIAFDLRHQRRDTCCARRTRPERAQRAPSSPGGVASRSPQRGARGQPPSGGKGAVDLASVRSPIDRPIRGGAGPRDTAHARRSRGRRAFRASPALHRAPSQASPGRENERDLGLSDDTPRAGHGLFRTEGAGRTSHESFGSNEIAELPIAMREAPVQARRRAMRPGSMRRGDHPQRAHAPRLLSMSPSESRHTCHSHRSIPGPNLTHDHQPARRIENGTTADPNGATGDDDRRFTTHASERASQQAFFGASALLFAASAA